MNKKVINGLLKIEQRDGILSPETILAEAQNSNSPLHSRFQWDDSKAARAYRLWQARKLIKQVRVEIMGRVISQFLSVRVDVEDKKVRAYIRVEKVLSDEELYRSALSDALKELTYWQNKYNHLREIKSLVNNTKINNLEKVLELESTEAVPA